MQQELSQLFGMYAEHVIQARQEQVAATDIDLYHYQHQGSFLLRTTALRSFWRRFTDHVVAHPGVVTTLAIVGESGGVGKSHTAAEAVARLNYGKKIIQRVNDDNEDLLEASFMSLPTVGLDLMGELDAEDEPMIWNTPPNWDVLDKKRVRTRWHDSIVGMREKANEMYPGKRIVLVAEGVFSLMGDLPVDENTFVMFRTTEPEAQKGAAGERATFRDPSLKPADVYKSHGGGIDDVEISGEELELWMGNGASAEAGRAVVNRWLLMNNPLLVRRGVEKFDLPRLQTDLDFRNNRALPVLYEIMAERWGVAEGQSIITPNIFEPGKTRTRRLHQKVLNGFRVNSREWVDPGSVGYIDVPEGV